jgi:hypothetical protein
MIEEKPDPIDRFFKENFEKVEVQYNAVHWSQLQNAMLVAAAGGAGISSLPPGKWMKLWSYLKGARWKILFLMGIWSIGAVIVWNNQNKEVDQLIMPEHNSLNKQDNFNVEQSVADTLAGHSEGTTQGAYLTPPLVLPDSTLPELVLKGDSLDSLKVDTAKVYIFW